MPRGVGDQRLGELPNRIEVERLALRVLDPGTIDPDLGPKRRDRPGDVLHRGWTTCRAEWWRMSA